MLFIWGKLLPGKLNGEMAYYDFSKCRANDFLLFFFVFQGNDYFDISGKCRDASSSICRRPPHPVQQIPSPYDPSLSVLHGTLADFCLSLSLSLVMNVYSKTRILSCLCDPVCLCSSKVEGKTWKGSSPDSPLELEIQHLPRNNTDSMI